MRALDDTDMAILRMLAEDGRRPFSDIAAEVGLSGPAVSDRVQRLRDAGVIERFTVSVDRSQLRAGVEVFVQLDVAPDSVDAVRDRVQSAEAVEHCFLTADGGVWFAARVAASSARRWVFDLVGDADVREVDVTLVDESTWTPSVAGTAFALSCAECGNTVDEEGESQRLGGDVYHFCCSSCEQRFVERYEQLEAGA
jgi:DNA-binding Lrp family transcriptional regulator/YHS domain-containing protein